MGAGEAFICAGVESMTRVPMMGFNPMPNPGLVAETARAPTSAWATRRRTSPRKWQIPRATQEAFAVRSHRKAAAAQAAGKLRGRDRADQATASTVDAGRLHPPRHHAEGLAGLKPAFDEDGSVTAGTSSPLTDGAAAVLVCTRGLCGAARADAAGAR